MVTFPKSRDFRGRSVALLTKHGKAAVIAPVLAELDLTVVHSEDFDTDTLGTFSGEVERTLSPLECARTKAKLACKFTGLDIGLGSEGSFGGGPLPGLLNWDSELLVLHHAANDFEIVAQAAGPVSLVPIEIASLEDLEEKLWPHDPQQAWIMRPHNHVIKGLYGEANIAGHLRILSLVDQDGRLKVPVRIEPDLRSDAQSAGSKYIRQAAKQLVETCSSHVVPGVCHA